MEIINQNSKWIGVLGASGKVFVQKFTGQDLSNNVAVVESTEPFRAESKEEAQRKAERELRA